MTQLAIERCIPGGDGMGRMPDGRVVFVEGAFPGDVVELLETSEHRGYVRATRWLLSTPAPSRRPPPCHFADRCGGCDWMTVSEPVQAELKLKLAEDALRRTGKLTTLGDAWGLHQGSALGYRSRLRLHLDAEGQLGLHARGSHQVVPITRCIVSSDRVNAALRTLRDEFEAVEPRHRQAFAGRFSGLELRCLAARDELFVHRREGRTPKRHADGDVLLARLDVKFETLIEGKRARPSQHQPLALDLTGETVPDVSLVATPGTFTQVNWEINAAIVQSLVDGCKHRNITSFVDLFCGIGNFTVPLLAAGLPGLGVENNAGSIECARSAAQRYGGSVEFEVSNVAIAANRLARQGRRFDLVVVDPPRAGLRDAVDDIATLCAGYIFYCACDPVSFARDLHRLTRLGFELQRLEAFDMFPQTHHVELVAWLRKNRS